jgi:hypothetical protein
MSEALEKLFKTALEDVTVSPPERVWKRIDAHFSAKRRFSRRLLAYSGAAAAVLLVLSLFFFQNTREDPVSPELLAQRTLVVPSEPIFVTMTPPHSQSNNTPRQRVTPVEMLSPVLLSPTQFSGDALPNHSIALTLDPMMAHNVIPITSGAAYENAQKYGQLLGQDTPVSPRVSIRDIRKEREEKTTGQNKQTNMRYTVGGYVAPGYSSGEYRSTSDASNSSVFGDSQLGGVYNINGGLTFAVNTSARLAIETGVGFSRVGQTADITYHSSMSLSPTARSVITPLGNVSSSQALVVFNDSNEESLEGVRSYQSGTLEQRFDAIDIPLHLRYYLNDAKLKFSVLGGIGTHILVDNRTYLQSSDSRENIGATDGIRTLNFSTRVGLGVEYPITRAIHFKFEPLFRYYLQSISSDSNISFKPYSFNLSTGIGIRF